MSLIGIKRDIALLTQDIKCLNLDSKHEAIVHLLKKTIDLLKKGADHDLTILENPPEEKQETIVNVDPSDKEDACMFNGNTFNDDYESKNETVPVQVKKPYENVSSINLGTNEDKTTNNENKQELANLDPLVISLNLDTFRGKKMSVQDKVEEPDFGVDSKSDSRDITIAERKIKTKSNGTIGNGKRVKKRKYERKIDRSFTVAVPTFQYSDLTCHVCEKTLISERMLYVHVHNHHGPHPERKCKQCDQLFYSPWSLDLHVKKVHAEKLPCVECGKLVLKGQMFTHMRIHDEVGHLKCDQCSKTFKYKKSLERHGLRDHSDSFGSDNLKHTNPNREMERKCDEECNCGLQFSSLRAKLDHYKLVHLGYERCGKCNRITKEGLKHTCNPDYKPSKRIATCKVCGETFSSSGMLHNHWYTVHEVQSASCEFCGKVFRDQVKLKSHLRKVNHTGKTPCEICGLSVLNMKAHIKTAHVDDSLKAYQCTICGKGFVKKRKFDTHMNAVHYKIKPYKCRYGCDIAYGELGNRNSHEKKKHGGLFEILRKDSLGQTLPKKYNDDKYNC